MKAEYINTARDIAPAMQYMQYHWEYYAITPAIKLAIILPIGIPKDYICTALPISFGRTNCYNIGIPVTKSILDPILENALKTNKP